MCDILFLQTISFLLSVITEPPRENYKDGQRSIMMIYTDAILTIIILDYFYPACLSIIYTYHGTSTQRRLIFSDCFRYIKYFWPFCAFVNFELFYGVVYEGARHFLVPYFYFSNIQNLKHTQYYLQVFCKCTITTQSVLRLRQIIWKYSNFCGF